MTTSASNLMNVARRGADDGAARLAAHLEALRSTFRADFALLDAEQGIVLHAADGGPAHDWSAQVSVCCEVARRQRAEFIADEDPLLVLAVPLSGAGSEGLVAVGLFLSRPLEATDDLRGAAAALQIDAGLLGEWARRQEAWSPATLQRIAELHVENAALARHNEQLRSEVQHVSTHLLTTYEEISLLHQLTQNLKLSLSEAELAEMALEWLSEVVPVEGLAIQWTFAQADAADENPQRKPLLTHGDCRLDSAAITSLVEELSPKALTGPVVFNRADDGEADARFPDVGQLIAVPILESDHVFGWMVAVNHREGRNLGSVEASLLSSVGAILGIHRGNIDLYRQQADFLANVVRALTSAIDAKDPYTCGHSDRVARISVRLARELECDSEAQQTLYMSGLLHDIGKIGIDDSVLRCPGRLTSAQYEHIKLHPELGYKILRDLKQLEPVLPIVLHHHEAWDGSGYPHGLAGEDIPLLARIAAVADAYDAMSSDRPYRRGMPRKKLDTVMREGAGKQWDARVIDAFFKIREEIEEIARREREALQIDIADWQ